MLPEKMRFGLFDRLSVKTMRYVQPVPRREARGLVKRVYDMIADDFFVNGSLSSHSGVPELMAGVWVGGRETILVSDYLDQTTKEAMAATLSSIDDCPYCGDMLVSLVHSGGDHQAASQILSTTEEHIADNTLRNRLEWVKAVATLPDDLAWAKPNPRIADALSRWARTVEKHAQGLIPAEVEKCVRTNLHSWAGEQMPISRSWVEKEVGEVAGKYRAITKLALVLAKAPYQIEFDQP